MAGVKKDQAHAHVAIVDDDRDTRLCLKDILQTAENFKVVGSFSNALDALETVPHLRPDVMLMDIQLPDLNGIECTRRLKSVLPRLKIVIMTGTHERNHVGASLQAGASAYLFKPLDGEQLLATLRFTVAGPIPDTVADGVDFAGEKTIALAKNPPGTHLPLSPREREVLAALAEGLLYKEISQKLGISYAAVHKHQHNIFRKLHVSNRSEATRRWLDSRS